MSQVTQSVKPVYWMGTPEKRLYWSIISDYDIKTGICELIDNAIDLWMATKPRPALAIDLIFDAERQLIQIKDTAGGVKEEDPPVVDCSRREQEQPRFRDNWDFWRWKQERSWH